MKGEWKRNISLDFTGIYRKPQETTGIYRNLQEMSERAEFHARLATTGRVYIPKIMLGFPKNGSTFAS